MISAMPREFLCSSHTISGVMPGSPRAARHSLQERLAACAAAGYAGFWLHFRDYLEQRAAGFEDASIRDLFDRHGMRHRGVEFLTDWFLDDPAQREMEGAAFAAARAIGAPLVNVGADFLGRNIPRGRMIKAFAGLCTRAADGGLSVALEIVPWSDVPDIRTALDFMEPSNAGLVIDCWHIFRGRVPLADLARIAPTRILCVQVSDAASQPDGTLQEDTLLRKLCGQGEFDLAGFAAALDGIGVDIPWSVEIIAPDFAALPVRQAARLSQESAQRTFQRMGERG
jgi:sugar phosphate isomerase/epimerase